MEHTRIETLLQELQREPQRFFGHAFSFSWWVRGGEPGSPSDKLTLEGERGAVNGKYIRARFDPARDPHIYSEKFTGNIDRSRAAALLQRLFESSLYATELKEENDRGMRDIRKETWTFSRGNVQAEKTLYEPLPPSLDNLRSLCRDITDQLVRSGKSSTTAPAA